MRLQRASEERRKQVFVDLATLPSVREATERRKGWPTLSNSILHPVWNISRRRGIMMSTANPKRCRSMVLTYFFWTNSETTFEGAFSCGESDSEISSTLGRITQLFR